MSDDPYPRPGFFGRPSEPSGQHPAEVRPGLTAPEPDPGRLPHVPDDLMGTLEAARSLFRISTHPFNDAEYRHLEPGLRMIDRRLEELVRGLLGDDELFGLFEEVRGMLMRGRHA